LRELGIAALPTNRPTRLSHFCGFVSIAFVDARVRYGGLVVVSAEGDRAAFAELRRVYLPVLLRWCLCAAGDSELAADFSSA
jgi:hypothetical protein